MDAGSPVDSDPGPARWMRAVVPFFLGLVVLVGAPGSAAGAINESGPLFTRASQAASVPAEVSNHVMCVNVLINGQGPFRMLVDTGCSFSMISPEVADVVEARGLNTEDEDVEAVNGLGDVVATPRVVLESITVGSIRFEGVVAGVVPLELQSKIDGRSLDGILGYSLFSDLFVGLDYRNQRLRLSEQWPEGLPPVRAELPTVEQDEVPFVTVRIQGRDFRVMVDTGANDRVHLSPDLIGDLTWKVEPRPGVMLAVAGETAREKIGRLEGTLDLGRLHQPNPVIEISAGTPTIGIGLLQPYILVFHQAEEKLWLCSTRDGPIPSPPELTVGLSYYAEANGWRIAGIIPDSPAAAAGIKAGDLVTEIEGQPAHGWTRDRIQGWIDTHPSIAMKVASGAAEHDFNLRVWDLVP